MWSPFLGRSRPGFDGAGDRTARRAAGATAKPPYFSRTLCRGTRLRRDWPFVGFSRFPLSYARRLFQRGMGSEAVMASIEERSPAGRSLPMEISNLIVRLFSEYTGRGPNKARTIIRGNLIVCVTHGN